MSKPVATTVETHVELGNLPLLVSLPRTPIGVQWKLADVASGSAATLLALLRFSPEDYRAIARESGELEGPAPATLPADLYDGWLPEEAKAGLTVKREGELCNLPDALTRQPTLFTQLERSPYKNGRVVMLSNGYVLVSLYAM